MILHRIQIPEGLLLSGSRSDFFGESLALGNPFNRTSPNPGEKVLPDNVFIFRSTVVTIETLTIQIMSVVSVLL